MFSRIYNSLGTLHLLSDAKSRSISPESFTGKPGEGYTTFSTAYSGLPQVIRPDGLYRSQTCFGMYRWHITDPIRFEKKLRVTIQDLGWRSERRYLPQQSDIASVAFRYQTLPHAPLKPLGSRDELEVIPAR